MANKEKYHHGDLRGALVDALSHLIERDGPDGFRIAEACRIAGVSTAAPYKHFADRSDMLRAVALSGMIRLRDSMQAAADSFPPGDPRRINGLGRAYFNFARTEPGMFRMMFGLTEKHQDDAELRQIGDDANAIVAKVVSDQMGLSPEDPQVQLRSYALWCIVHGHSFLALDGKLEGDGAEIEDPLLELSGRAIVPSISP